MQRDGNRSASVFGTVLTFVVLSWYVAAGAASPAPPSAPPASLFARLPPILDVQLSPDGTRAVMLRAIGETYHAVLADFTAGTMRPLLAADPEEFLFNWCRWANGERVVCSIRSYGTRRVTYETLRGVQPPRYWYQGQEGGSDAPQRNRRYRDGRTVFTRLLAVNADGSDPLQLIPEPEGRAGPLEWNDNIQDTVVSWLDDDPRHILVQLRRDEPDAPTVFRLDIYDNELTEVRRPHGAVRQWYADRHGALRLALGYRRTEPVVFGVRDNRLQHLNQAVRTGLRPPVVMAVAADGDSAYVVAGNGRDTRGLYRIDTVSGELLETLHVDPEYDLDGARLLLDPATGRPVVLSYHRDQPANEWFDADLQRAIERLQVALPGQPSAIRIVSTDAHLRKLVLATEGAGTRPRLYLYDRERPGDLVLLAEQYPDLETVVPRKAVVYRARDGVRIHAYLTLPPNRRSGERLPTVILPRGGPRLRETLLHWPREPVAMAPLPWSAPWRRAFDGFDMWSQLLTSRGYAVLQPNVRGSTGYGDRFFSAGFGQQGDAEHDDLVDGLDWLIAEGIADPERVCIVGGGYGGYAALVAAYRTPERLRCAVSFAGPADLPALARRWRTYPLGELAVARLPEGPALRDRSPLAHVDRIGVPLLIVHGDEDRSVVVDQSRRLVRALRAAEQPHRYIEQQSGDHFLSLQSQRTQFIETLDEFLASHLRL